MDRQANEVGGYSCVYFRIINNNGWGKGGVCPILQNDQFSNKKAEKRIKPCFVLTPLSHLVDYISLRIVV